MLCWISWASRSRLPAFVKVARTIRKCLDDIVAYIRHRLTNGLVEGLNNKARLLTRRAYGFHSASSAIAMIMLCCTGINIAPPGKSLSPPELPEIQPLEANNVDGLSYRPLGEQSKIGTLCQEFVKFEYPVPITKKVVSVGTRSQDRSPFGVYDLSSNVAEWVSDWMDRDYYKKSPVRDPRGPAAGKFKVIRGESWRR